MARFEDMLGRHQRAVHPAARHDQVEQDQQVEAQHRGRQHQRQRHRGLHQEAHALTDLLEQRRGHLRRIALEGPRGERGVQPIQPERAQRSQVDVVHLHRTRQL